MAQPQTAPISVNLTVSWNSQPSSPPVITGGDNNGGNVTIPKAANNRIIFHRNAGEDWTFSAINLGIQVDVNSGNYPINTTWNVNVQSDQIGVVDNDNNDTGCDQLWNYSLRLATPETEVATDPIIINKSSTP